MRTLLAGVSGALWLAASAAGAQAPTPSPSEVPVAGFDPYEVPPKPLRMAKPEYPAAAFARDIEGTVEIEIVIDAKGRVADARVVKSVPELDAAALKCIKKWRFEPAQKNGKPVATTARAPVTFRKLEKAEKKP